MNHNTDPGITTNPELLLAESEAIVLRLLGDGFTTGDIEHIVDVVQASDPAQTMARWIDHEPRTGLRKRLARMLLVLVEEAGR